MDEAVDFSVHPNGRTIISFVVPQFFFLKTKYIYIIQNKNKNYILYIIYVNI